jgi:hypothetical protein
MRLPSMLAVSVPMLTHGLTRKPHPAELAAGPHATMDSEEKLRAADA